MRALITLVNDNSVDNCFKKILVFEYYGSIENNQLKNCSSDILSYLELCCTFLKGILLMQYKYTGVLITTTAFVPKVFPLQQQHLFPRCSHYNNSLCSHGVPIKMNMLLYSILNEQIDM